MTHVDLAVVADIERRSYDFPWNHGVFRDCMLAGYHCAVLQHGNHVVGYAILSVAAGEAHILNLCVDPAFRRLDCRPSARYNLRASSDCLRD